VRSYKKWLSSERVVISDEHLDVEINVKNHSSKICRRPRLLCRRRIKVTYGWRPGRRWPRQQTSPAGDVACRTATDHRLTSDVILWLTEMATGAQDSHGGVLGSAWGDAITDQPAGHRSSIWLTNCTWR